MRLRLPQNNVRFIPLKCRTEIAPFAAAYQNASNVRIPGSIEETSNSPRLQRSERKQAKDDLP